MEPKILEEIGEHYKQDVIDVDWGPFEKNQKDMGSSIPLSVTSFPYLPLFL
jgi:hypothetical protein